MHWYNREIRKYTIGTMGMVVWTLIATIFVSVWVYFTSDYYEWQNIEIIPLVPWVRILLSALTYVTLWRLLYKSQIVYRPLHFVIVRIFRNKKLYNEAKDIIWFVLLGVMCFVILPVIVSFLNFLISCVYNFALFLIYISPPIAILWIMIWVIFYFQHKKAW
jgi:hypothetical protein